MVKTATTPKGTTRRLRKTRGVYDWDSGFSNFANVMEITESALMNLAGLHSDRHPRWLLWMIREGISRGGS